MKKVLAVMILFIMTFAISISVSARSVKISKKNFPDKEFREVLTFMDNNHDGWLTNKEQKKKKAFFLDNVTNLKGISKLKLVNFVEVNHCVTKKIKNVNELYQLKNLESIYFNYCKIGNFDPNKIKKLKKISYHNVQGKVKDYNFKNNKKLEKLSLINTEIHSLKLKGATNIRLLELCSNGNDSKIKKIDIAMFKNLEVLQLCNLPIKKLDVSKNSKLNSIKISNTNIEEIDLSKNKKITSVIYKISETLKQKQTKLILRKPPEKYSVYDVDDEVEVVLKKSEENVNL